MPLLRLAQTDHHQHADCPTVTPMDELWAVSVSGGLRHRLTETLVHTINSHVNTGSLRGEDLEEEWEVI